MLHYILIIKSKNYLLFLNSPNNPSGQICENLKEIWVYKDLILLLVKRDVTSVYKQTILGPLWMFIQPIFATLIYTFTFGQANLPTDGIPASLFYLIGQTFWNYFSECFQSIDYI